MDLALRVIGTLALAAIPMTSAARASGRSEGQPFTSAVAWLERP